MPNATLGTLINNLGTVAVDTTATDTYQDEMFLALARLAFPGVLVQTGAAFVAATRGTAEYTLPSGHRTPLLIGFDDTEMQGVEHQEAQLFNPTWRDQLGRPIAFTFDPVNRDRFQVIPTPLNDGETIGGNTPITFGPFPAENFWCISTTSDTAYSSNSYADTFLALAFEVLAREFGRDSDHHDPEGAQIAAGLANLFWRMSFPEVDSGKPH